MSVAPAEGPLCLSSNRSVEWNINFVIKYSIEKTLINVERSIWLNILSFGSIRTNLLLFPTILMLLRYSMYMKYSRYTICL